MKTIYLAPGAARCIGAQCTNPKQCARKMASHQLDRPVGDYSRTGGECNSPKWHYYLDVITAIEHKAEAVAEPKEWHRGLAVFRGAP